MSNTHSKYTLKAILQLQHKKLEATEKTDFSFMNDECNYHRSINQ